MEGPVTKPRAVRVGTAGWSIPRAVADAFPTEGSSLERYAARFNAVEINSTFYRSHQPKTFERWRAATPADFQFAVKAPKAITHEARLVGCASRLARFFDELAPLAEKLGPVLVQAPPSLAFDRQVAEPFFAALRALWRGPVVFEPRHLSWLGVEAAEILATHRIDRVAADPVLVGDGVPRPDARVAYWRLHGSPRLYYSSYEPSALAALAQAISDHPAPDRWCIFDNTASGAAAANGLDLMTEIARASAPAG